MADPPSKPDVQGDHDDTSRTPRWVTAFAIIIIVLLLLFVIMHLTGDGMRNHAV